MTLNWNELEKGQFFFHSCIISDRGTSEKGPYGNPSSAFTARGTSQICRKEVMTMRDFESLKIDIKGAQVDFRLFFPGEVSGLALGDLITNLTGETGTFELVAVVEESKGDPTLKSFNEFTGATNHVEVLIARLESE
jgi:hypothetical protein